MRMEDTVQTVTPDAKGWISIKPWLVNEKVSDSRGGSAEGYISYFVEEGKPGMRLGGYSGATMEELVIETYTLNEDGTVTFAAYVPKGESQYLN